MTEQHDYYPPGSRQCACGVWMTDDGRQHCAVCEYARAPHLAMRDGVCVWVPGDEA